MSSPRPFLFLLPIAVGLSLPAACGSTGSPSSTSDATSSSVASSTVASGTGGSGGQTSSSSSGAGGHGGAGGQGVGGHGGGSGGAGGTGVGAMCDVDMDCMMGLICQCANDACHDCGGNTGTCQMACMGG
jgi:hypothetical protein